MQLKKLRWWLIGVTLALVYVLAVILVLELLPHPLTRTDYLVAGSLATLLVLLALFLALGLAGLISGAGFTRRGKKP